MLESSGPARGQGLPPIDQGNAVSSASRVLPARYEAVRGARQFTRSTLLDWELGERFDDTSLVVSELVTNALRHALPSDTPQTSDIPRTQEPPVRLHLMRWPSRLVCAVRDPSQESPIARETSEDFDAECGRGLFLVESFSDSWGWHPLAGPLGGKVVWALFRL